MAHQEVSAQTPFHKSNAPINRVDDILNIAFAPLTNYFETLEIIPGDEIGDTNLNAHRTAEILRALFDSGHSTAMAEFAKARSAGIEVV